MDDCCHWLRDKCSNSSCASVCTRTFLVIINFIFLLIGWAVFVLGVWLHLNRENLFYAAIFQDNSTGPVVVLGRVSLMLIGVGAFVVTISFLGCCGACTESVCFLGFYAFLLVVAIVAQVCFASLASTFRQKIYSNMAASMSFQIRYEYNATGKYSNRTNTNVYRITKAWDEVQVKLKCCGANGPFDYRHSSWYNHTDFASGAFVPASCCVIDDGGGGGGGGGSSGGGGRGGGGRGGGGENGNHAATQCDIDAIAAISNYPNVTDASESQFLNTRGCHSALVDWFGQYEYLANILWVVIILQIVDFIYACILMSWLRKSLTDYSWCEEDEFQ